MSGTPGGDKDPFDDLDERFEDAKRDLDDRWPESRLEPSLDRVRAVLDLLANPELSYPVIHVAGTNGKTSTARMIDALLVAFGLHTGRFTSPHLSDVRERIAFEGKPIDVARFVAAYEDVVPFVDIVDARNQAETDADGNELPRLSYFELLAVTAFAAFADAPVDAAVVEVGMGGTWDATNVVYSQVAVITPVGLDHQAYLGDTIEQIAGEKAGVIKPGGVVVMADQLPAAGEVIARQAAQLEAELVREGADFGVVMRELALGGQVLTLRGLGGGLYDEVFLPLHGAHQARNAAVALAAVEAFFGAGAARLDVDTVREGFASVTSPGRLEAVRRSPTVLVDAAHNPAGATALAATLGEEFGFQRLVAVVGMLEDKDAIGFLAALEPVVDAVVVTEPHSPRAWDPDALGALAVSVFGDDRVEVVPAIADAIERALELAEEDGVTSGAGVLVTGSVVTVGEARRLLHRPRPGAPSDD